MIGNLSYLNQKDIKLEKSRIYKQMLDNQILLNKKYKRQMEVLKQKTIQLKQPQISPIPIHHDEGSSGADNSSSIVKQIMKSRLKQSKLKNPKYLPTIMDANRYIRGESKYINVEEYQEGLESSQAHKSSQRLQFPKLVYKQHTNTGYIKDDDEYISSCQKIIMDLQQISEGIHGENRFKQKFNKYNQNRERNYRNQSYWDKYEKESRYAPRYNTEFDNGYERIQNPHGKSYTNEVQSRFTQNPEKKYRNNNENGSSSQLNYNYDSNRNGRTNFNSNTSSMPTQNRLKTEQNRQSQNYSKIQSRTPINKQITSNTDEVKLNKYGSQKIKNSKLVMMDKSRRDNFIKELRNAKSRGENLYMKLNQRKLKKSSSK